jgi:glycosyltransferase involved in cell wall biosynthesis
MTKQKVFLTGGEGIGWAVDEDIRLAQKAMEGLVDFVSLQESHVIHCAWWEGLGLLEPRELEGKVIVCQVPGEPFRYLSIPRHRHAVPLVNLWVTRSSQAYYEFKSIGISSHKIPYLVDENLFHPMDKKDPVLRDMRSKWNIPSDAYIIGSFSRDSEGANLLAPKLVKGPDIFFHIVRQLRNNGANIHVLLAGPRRHWLLDKLRSDGISHSFIGIPRPDDDINSNFLPRTELNLLYNLIDLYVVSSRSEGGPHAILEAASTKCKIVSTDVGMARDVLHPSCIYSSVPDAVQIISRDIKDHQLRETTDRHFHTILERHTPQKAAPLFTELYEKVGRLHDQGLANPPKRRNLLSIPRCEGAPSRAERIHGMITIGLWHKFFAPPYGGGNQFMMALRKALVKKGVDVRENQLTPEIDAYILNSIHFDVEGFLEFSRSHRINVIHRIDGPIHLIRGFDREKDELCYELNATFASATVLQSAWTYQRIVELGYQPVLPTIIHNAVDSDIFHPQGRISFSGDRKIRLISTSWSNNPRKGGPMYKWIEQHIDWNMYEYTFVGNLSEPLERARCIPPVSSEELADILRHHDIYITASQNDPCSNALIEAMACGLPALYLNDGGHPELVGQGGLPFHSQDDFLPALQLLTENHQTFQQLITVSNLDDVAEKYLVLAEEVAAS